MSSPYPKELPRNTREFVRIGFNDACINFLVQFSKHDFDELELCIADVTEYNAYRGASVAKAFSKIKHYLRRASFGREGSPVLYLKIEEREWIGEQLIAKTTERIATEIREIKNAFSRTHVDEFHLRDEGHNDVATTVRLWWE